MSCCYHLDGAVQVEHHVSDVICVVHCRDASHNERMISHAPILDEAAFRPKLLQRRSNDVRLQSGSTQVPLHLWSAQICPCTD